MVKYNKMGNQQEKALSWFAGIMDGEGHLTLARQTHSHGRYHYRPLIAIANTNPVLIARIVEVAGELGWPSYIMRRNSNRSINPHWVYQITGLQRCEKILNDLYPYLIAKRLPAQIALQYTDYRKSLIRGFPVGPLDEQYKVLMGKANNLFKFSSAILRDHRPTSVEETEIIWSELRRELESLAEMTKPALMS